MHVNALTHFRHFQRLNPTLIIVYVCFNARENKSIQLKDKYHGVCYIYVYMYFILDPRES